MDATTNFIIPTPPVNPLFASESDKNYPRILAYNTRGYSRLVKSLPYNELYILELNMKNVTEKEASDLAARINANRIVLNGANTREITVIALKALQLNYLSIEQVASLHMVDGAISDLITHPTMFLSQRFAKDGAETTTNTLFAIPLNETYPTSLISRHYTSLGIMSADCNFNGFEAKYSEPILKRFFYLTNNEWQDFRQRMEDPQRNIPPSEKQIYLLNAPDLGCWSKLVALVQRVIQPFHSKTVVEKLKAGGFLFEKKMVVPSFSMLQILLEVKGATLGRPAPKFIATYNRLNEDDYTREKMNDLIALSLYFPESNNQLRYNRENPNFKGEIDGHAHEGPFASMIHDVYHALREMAMSPNIALARFRLATIAQNHQYDRIDSNSKKVSEILIDGELIHSYPRDKDTTFTLKGRGNSMPQTFGELFYTKALQNSLHPKLKNAFIQDMVTYKDEWKENFNLGRENLLPQDQMIYDELEHALDKLATEHLKKIKLDE